MLAVGSNHDPKTYCSRGCLGSQRGRPVSPVRGPWVISRCQKSTVRNPPGLASAGRVSPVHKGMRHAQGHASAHGLLWRETGVGPVAALALVCKEPSRVTCCLAPSTSHSHTAARAYQTGLHGCGQHNQRRRTAAPTSACTAAPTSAFLQLLPTHAGCTLATMRATCLRTRTWVVGGVLPHAQGQRSAPLARRPVLPQTVCWPQGLCPQPTACWPLSRPRPATRGTLGCPLARSPACLPLHFIQ